MRNVNARPLPAVVGLALSATACALPGVPDLPPPGPPSAAPIAAVGMIAEAEPGPDCFQRHLGEAISLNRRRSPTYAEWSDGASRDVSGRLIALERWALLGARYVDDVVRPFQRAGLTIGCAEFVSMSLTPPLGRQRPGPPAEAYRPGPSADSVTAAILEGYGRGGFAGVAAAADRTLDTLAAAPDYHCMVRHLVESIWRVATLAPAHAAAAEAAGLRSTLPVSRLLLRLHLAALPEGARLDREAAPLQEAGVPILCRDVPALRHPVTPPGSAAGYGASGTR